MEAKDKKHIRDMFDILSKGYIRLTKIEKENYRPSDLKAIIDFAFTEIQSIERKYYALKDLVLLYKKQIAEVKQTISNLNKNQKSKKSIVITTPLGEMNVAASKTKMPILKKILFDSNTWLIETEASIHEIEKRLSYWMSVHRSLKYYFQISVIGEYEKPNEKSMALECVIEAMDSAVENNKLRIKEYVSKLMELFDKYYRPLENNESGFVQNYISKTIDSKPQQNYFMKVNWSDNPVDKIMNNWKQIKSRRDSF